MTTSPGAVLSIAGSDPSGGAGIQADLKTFTSLDVYGSAAISCLTVQNSLGVYRIEPLRPELVREQIEKVLTDLPISHIKTGMIGNTEVAKAIGDCLAGFNGTVVCDPVLKASDGHDLLTKDGLTALCQNIIANATVLTPNFMEFKILTGLDSDEETYITEAVAEMLSRNPNLEAIVVKGGHRREEHSSITDFLFLRSNHKFKLIKAQRDRIETKNNHGTGCTFASALTAYHLKTRDWRKAFHLAGDYVAELLKLSVDKKMGRGNGPLWHHLFRSKP